MLNPSIGKLLETYESRYELVIDVARRARKISEYAEMEGQILTEKPVTNCHQRAGCGQMPVNRRTDKEVGLL